MTKRKLFKNHQDRMLALLTKKSGLDYPTGEIADEAFWYAKSKVEELSK